MVKNVIAMRMQSSPTIAYMAGAKGSIPLKYRENAIRIISRWIQQQQDEGKTQTEIGKMLGGLAQGTVSELQSRKTSKLGVKTLFAAREAIGISIDDLLGLPPFADRRDDGPPSASVASRRSK